jgi:hypothetical protein
MSESNLGAVLEGVFGREGITVVVLADIPESLPDAVNQELGLKKGLSGIKIKEKLGSLPAGFEYQKKGRTHVICREITPANFLRDLFKQIDKPFLRISQLPGYLPSGSKLKEGLTNKSTMVAIKTKLGPLPPPYNYYKEYILPTDPSDALLAIIHGNSGKTYKQITAKIFLTKPECMAMTNHLLKTGVVYAQIGKNENLYIHINEQPQASACPTVTPLIPPSREELQKAYERLRKGSNPLHIYALRRYLNWSFSDFDQMLYDLLMERKVQPFMGNPERLSDDQIADSYKAPDGTLYIAILWKGAA